MSEIVISTPETETRDIMVALQPTWSDLRARYERSLIKTKSGVICGDPELAYKWKSTERQMNGLLEKYYSQLVTVGALDGVDHESVISEHVTRNLDEGKGDE